MNYSDYQYADTDDVIESYFGPGLELSYSYFVGKWALTTAATYENRKYKADSSGVIRRDDKSDFSATAGYSLNSWARIYLNMSYALNSSNDSDSDYRQFVSVLGWSGTL